MPSLSAKKLANILQSRLSHGLRSGILHGLSGASSETGVGGEHAIPGSPEVVNEIPGILLRVPSEYGVHVDRSESGLD